MGMCSFSVNLNWAGRSSYLRNCHDQGISNSGSLRKKPLVHGKRLISVHNESKRTPDCSAGSSDRRRAANKYANRTDPFLVVCRCFSVVTIISALLCVVVNVLSAIQSFKNGEDIFDGILRCYAVLIALFVVVAETEWERIQKFWRILEYWVGRGMLQIFVTVMTRALSEGTATKKYIVLLREIASYMLLACGVIYVIAGLL